MAKMSGARSEGVGKVRRKRTTVADVDEYIHYGKSGKDGKGVDAGHKDGIGREGLDVVGIVPVAGDVGFAALVALPVAWNDGGVAVAAARAGGMEMWT